MNLSVRAALMARGCAGTGVLFLGLAVALYAQVDNGAINGTVTDPSGSAVAQAIVAVRNIEKGFERTMTTTESGVYSFAVGGTRF